MSTPPVSPRSGPFPARDMPTRILPPLRTTGPDAAATPVGPPPAVAPRTRRTFRSDIQGLRALAVLGVVLDHLLGWPRGGFVGVDVFFVVSGFLITGLLLRDADRFGVGALPRFYGRRVRRILPAALLVLGVTVLGATLLFNQVRAGSVLRDALAALGFVANWRFAAVGTDYFAAQGAPSPLQHYWSLAVEEQFYLVWPAVVVLAVGAAAVVFGRRARGPAIVGVAALVLGLASYAWAASESVGSPTVAYFSTLSRGWELAAGALIAALATRLGDLPAAARTFLGWLGLVGVVVSMLVIEPTSVFPAPWALLPVLSTALVIISGIGGDQPYLAPLRNPVTTFLGTISYSVYLWHAPVLAFLLVLVPTQSVFTTIAIGLVILALGAATYYLVEEPLHRSPLFESFGTAERRRDAWSTWRSRVSTQVIGGALGFVAIIAVVGVLSATTLGSTNPLAAAQGTTTTADSVQAELAQAVAATSWPALSPTLDEAMRTHALANPAQGCFSTGALPAAALCTWGLASAPHHLFLVGDSTALAYAPAFKVIAEESGGSWSATTVGLYGCRSTTVLVQSDDPEANAECAQRKDDIAALIAASAPDLIVVSNDFTQSRGADGSSLTVSTLVESATQESTRWNAAGRVVYLAPPPLGADLTQCYNAVSTPQACTVPVDSTWSAFAQATAQAAAATGDHYLDSLPFSCADGRCPPFGGTIPTKFDPVHMTAAWSAHIAPVLRDEFVAQGLLAP